MGVEEDIQQAIKFYLEAAEKGNATAQVNLGNIYEFGMLDGDPNPELCFQWYRAAAEQGDLTGIFNYANCYHEGLGVEQNYEKAFTL